ncbi:MAG: transposase [Proteobacteria bacterium]|nr:transposase [Pseudomonadota bacterium]MBU1686481.1 transposase [Pseudomonadota bacterium]
MSDYRRAKNKGGTYFFTVVTYRRERFLCDDDIRGLLRDAIAAARRTHPFVIDAWVLLPDHLHCIWILPPDDHAFGLRWSMIKRYVSQRCHRLQRPDRLNASQRKRHELTLWQRRFWEHLIRDEKDLRNHCDYIHYNSVKHGLVASPKDWPYSTFHRYVEDGIYPSSWGASLPAFDADIGYE